MTILVVEDETDLSDLLSFILRRAGHDVLLAFDGDSALRIWRERNPDLILLDINLPRRNGWQVCETIRRESTTPIMILSANDAEEDAIRGLDLGAEDYLTKPFSPKLLQARVRALLRRGAAESSAPGRGSTILVGDFVLDNDWRSITRGEQKASLTRLEHMILSELALHLGQVVPHAELIHKVWGYEGEATSSIVKGHIRNIRRKLEAIGSNCSIRIIAGVGYILSAESS